MNKQEIEQKFKDNIGLVYSCVKSYNIPEALKDDYVQEGLITLLKCIKTNDESRDNTFATYAMTSINFTFNKCHQRLNKKHIKNLSLNDINIEIPNIDSQYKDIEDIQMLYCYSKKAKLSLSEFKYIYRKIIKGLGHKEQIRKGFYKRWKADNLRLSSYKKLRTIVPISLI